MSYFFNLYLLFKIGKSLQDYLKISIYFNTIGTSKQVAMLHYLVSVLQTFSVSGEDDCGIVLTVKEASGQHDCCGHDPRNTDSFGKMEKPGAVFPQSLCKEQFFISAL